MTTSTYVVHSRQYFKQLPHSQLIATNTEKCIWLFHGGQSRHKHTISFDFYGNKCTPETDDNHQLACFMHGILGTKRNWRTPAMTWNKMHTNYSSLTFDHRGHGNSNQTHHKSSSASTMSSIVTHPRNDLKACAYDLIHLLQHENIKSPHMLFAHSFSGKVALKYLIEIEHINSYSNSSRSSLLSSSSSTTATSSSRTLFPPSHTWIIDSIPRKYKEDDASSSSSSTSKDSVIHVFEVLNKLPLVFKSKEWMMNELINNHLIEKGVALWLATNIVPFNPEAPTNTISDATSANSNNNNIILNSNESYFTWGFHLETIEELFTHFRETDLWNGLENYNGASAIHFLRAGKNKAWTNEILDDFSRLQESKKMIKLHTMPDVGHWVHVEDLKGMLSLISRESGL